MLNDSQFAMYEGMIALAWLDHTLDPSEKEELHNLIDWNINLSDQQREQLHKDVDVKIRIEDVWPRITDKQDRAHLLNIAINIFNQDGEYCALEQSAFNLMREAHISTINIAALQQDIAQLKQQHIA